MILLLLKTLRKAYGKVYGLKKRTFFNLLQPQYSGQASSDLIKEMLESDEPCMIARFGSIELDCVDFYRIYNSSKMSKYINFTKGSLSDLEWTEKMKYKMRNNTGFWPTSEKDLGEFSKLMIKEMKYVDVLGSWLDKENNFKQELKNTKTVKLEDLVPFIHQNPWSIALKNKKVLVIHPFTESINLQFNKKNMLFKDKGVLPDFELITYKPIQSFAGNYKNLEYKDWFEALESMERDISAIEFDIAILGCGSYGFPLASFIKKMGKKSIHLGGATQIMFGVMGKRWEEEYDMSAYINEYWIRPSIDETPKNFVDVEEGCYW